MSYARNFLQLKLEEIERSLIPDRIKLENHESDTKAVREGIERQEAAAEDIRRALKVLKP